MAACYLIFSGTVKYSGSSYPFPTTSETPRVVYNSRTDKPWPVALYLTPVSSAGGVAIKAGSLIAVLILRQTNNYNSDDFQFVWNIYANNDVVVPTGGCDVSARDVTVTLPDYPSVQCQFLLTVYCAKSQNPGVLPLRHNRRCGQLDFHQYSVVFTSAGRRRTVDAQRYDYSSE